MKRAKSYLQKLVESSPLRAEVIQSAIRFLQLPEGSIGLDAGCGIGIQAAMLAEAVGNNGHVTGIDQSSEFLAYAAKTVKSKLLNRITFQTGDISKLPFEDKSLDWVWSCDCIGYPTASLQPLLKEIKRVLKPGGTIAILAWTSQQFLPGYPLLEASLNASCSGVAPFYKGVDPTHCFQRALGWFQKEGYHNPQAKTFISDVVQPLSDEIKTAMVSLFEMLWGERQAETSEEDWQNYQRLCDPDSSEFILNIPDYYGFFSYSMFHAQS